MSDNPRPELMRQVRINRIFPDDLATTFVSHIVVQNQGDHFIISAFEVWPPPIVGDTEEERRTQLDAIDHVDAKCVARLVVTPARMAEFMDTLSINWQRYQAQLAGD